MELNEEFGKNLMQQAFDLWINPEIERRREAGRLPDDFVLRAAQVIMSLDANAPEVRSNEELKAARTVKRLTTLFAPATCSSTVILTLEKKARSSAIACL